MSERVDQRRELSGEALPRAWAERVCQRRLQLAGPCPRIEQRGAGRLLEPVQQHQLFRSRVSREPTGVLEQLLEQLVDGRARTGGGTTHVDITRGGEGDCSEAGDDWGLFVVRTGQAGGVEQLHGDERGLRGRESGDGQHPVERHGFDRFDRFARPDVIRGGLLIDGALLGKRGRGPRRRGFLSHAITSFRKTNRPRSPVRLLNRAISLSVGATFCSLPGSFDPSQAAMAQSGGTGVGTGGRVI